MNMNLEMELTPQIISSGWMEVELEMELTILIRSGWTEVEPEIE